MGEGLNHDYKVVPYAYKSKRKGKMIETAAAHGMTRSGRCYAPEDLGLGNPSREQNQRRNITNVELVEFWIRMSQKNTPLRNS